MRKNRYGTISLAILLALHCSSGAVAAEAVKDAAFYQKMLDHAQWSWNDSQASIFYSMTQSAFAYQIELIHRPAATDELTIRFVKDGKLVCSWQGHPHSVFVEKDNILVYARYFPSQQGCTLVAVNLTNGTELWHTQLEAIEKSAHSGYSNHINMNLSECVVVVHGKETFGNYDEIVDLKTGKTLAHRVYPKEKDGAKEN